MKYARIVLLLALAATSIMYSGCEKRKQMNASRPLVEEAIECLNLDKYPCAIEKLTEAAKINQNADIYFLLGNAYRGRYDETFDSQYTFLEIDAYKKSVELNGKNVDAIKSLADAYFKADDCEQAKIYYEKALSMETPEYLKNDMKFAINECDKKANRRYYEKPDEYNEDEE